MTGPPDALLRGLRPAWARVDLSRLAANYRAIAASVRVPVMPVIKADAYGHGAARVARHLEALGAPLLAVAYPEEGVALRIAGVRLPILVLAAFGPGQQRALVEHDLTPVVSTPETLEGVLSAASPAQRPLAVHLKVDTGMSRPGFSRAELPAAAARLRQAGLAVEGLMTHLAEADEDEGATVRQLDDFDAALADLARQRIRPRWVHAANSAGLAQLRPTHTLVRPGLLVYGVRPRPLAPVLDVRPVSSLTARIGVVRDVVAGAAVSYAGRWVASRPSRIATIPSGMPTVCRRRKPWPTGGS